MKKEKPPSYGLASIVLGTVADVFVAYAVYYAAILDKAKQPLQGAIIAGALFWIILTIMIYYALRVRGNRKYREKHPDE